MRWIVLLLALLLLPGCNWTTVETEIGYKGRARANAWLAAERFTEELGYSVRSLGTWRDPSWEDAVWFAPAAAINNESFSHSAEEWVEEGGHLIVLVEHAEATSNDWLGASSEVGMELAPALLAMLEKAGIELVAGEAASAETLRFAGENYAVAAKSQSAVGKTGGSRGVFVSVPQGEGRLSVLTDARIFRNRWIGENDHAALLHALIEVADFEGAVVYIRSTGLSFWRLIVQRLWPFLVGLGVLLALWLWKNFSRFGPMEPVEVPSVLRGYDHHLEALGDFHWRLDRAKALLGPLRDQIVERGQRLVVRSGQREEDFFQLLALRSGLPRERVFRALAEPAPADSAVLARTTADLQRLLQTLN